MPKRNSVQQQHRPCNVLTKSFHLSGRSSGLESVPLWQWEPGEPQIYDYQYGFKSRDYHNETTISRVPVDSRFSGHTTLQTYIACIGHPTLWLTMYQYQSGTQPKRRFFISCETQHMTSAGSFIDTTRRIRQSGVDVVFANTNISLS